MIVSRTGTFVNKFSTSREESFVWFVGFKDLDTTEVPFYGPHGNIFTQNDGMVIWSILVPIFSHFYMSALENEVFNSINKHNVYLMYVDVILLFTNSPDKINTIQETFQNNYVLNFTQEININNKISFLGVLIDTNNIDRFITSKYKKKTYLH